MERDGLPGRRPSREHRAGHRRIHGGVGDDVGRGRGAHGHLRDWTRLGDFSPGNVAAFYWDRPPADAKIRFYRAVYVPRKLP